MALFGKDKPSLPMYEELADTPWITRNRDLNTKTWNNLNRDWNSVNVMDDAIRQQLNAVADDWYNRSASDFERSYNQTMNKQLARDYNRLGTTGGTSSLLTRDNYNLMKQRELADLASNRSDRYDTLLDNELNRRYKWLNQNYQGWTDSGKVTQAQDVANWQLRNMNLDRGYQNDLQDYNSSFGTRLSSLLPTALGAAGSMFGPIGAMTGYNLGNTLFGGYATDMLNGGNGIDYNSLNNNFTTGDLYRGLGDWQARRGNNAWTSLERTNNAQSNTQSNTYGRTGTTTVNPVALAAQLMLSPYSGTRYDTGAHNYIA